MSSEYFSSISCLFNVVRTPDGQIKLYCKGADTILFERLNLSNEELKCTTSEHLNVGHILFLVFLVISFFVFFFYFGGYSKFSFDITHLAC